MNACQSHSEFLLNFRIRVQELRNASLDKLICRPRPVNIFQIPPLLFLNKPRFSQHLNSNEFVIELQI